MTWSLDLPVLLEAVQQRSSDNDPVSALIPMGSCPMDYLQWIILLIFGIFLWQLLHALFPSILMCAREKLWNEYAPTTHGPIFMVLQESALEKQRSCESLSNGDFSGALLYENKLTNWNAFNSQVRSFNNLSLTKKPQGLDINMFAQSSQTWSKFVLKMDLSEMNCYFHKPKNHRFF